MKNENPEYESTDRGRDTKYRKEHSVAIEMRPEQEIRKREQLCNDFLGHDIFPARKQGNEKEEEKRRGSPKGWEHEAGRWVPRSNEEKEDEEKS